METKRGLMNNISKPLILALVLVALFASTLPALAASWDNRYGTKNLYTNTQGDVNHFIRNVQTDLNTYYTNYSSKQITVDGYYGSQTVAAVKSFQTDMGFANKDIDGICGPQTKDALWAVYQGTIIPKK